jgi:hypothetical protein
MGADAPSPPVVTATMDSSFTVLSWPSGQDAGADDSLIERRTSKVVAQSLQRYSYVGTATIVPCRYREVPCLVVTVTAACRVPSRVR